MCTCILPTQNIVRALRLSGSAEKIFVHLKFLHLFHIMLDKMGEKKPADHWQKDPKDQRNGLWA